MTFLIWLLKETLRLDYDAAHLCCLIETNDFFQVYFCLKYRKPQVTLYIRYKRKKTF